MKNSLTLVAAIALFLSSCRGAKLPAAVVDEIPQIAPKVAPKLIPPAAAGQSLKALIQKTGDRARQAQATGKTAALAAIQNDQQISNENLWQVAYDTILDELVKMQRKSAIAAVRQELEEASQAMANDVVTEVRQEIPPQTSQESNVTGSQGQFATVAGKVAGSKNIRSGPGTKYSVQHTVHSGDRVQVLDAAQDEGGYTWHRVRLSNSGAEGWIAAQLLQFD